jgi:lysophospholipase L1-like esterase
MTYKSLIRLLLIAVLTASLTCCSTVFLPAVPFDASLNNTTVFMGDSITHFWPMPEHNAGISGQNTSAMLDRFSRDVLGRGYKRVVILGGTDDIILPPHDLSIVPVNLNAMATLARDAGIEVVLCELPPITWEGNDLNPQVVSVNETIRTLANEKGYLLVDYGKSMSGHHEYFRDGVHPTSLGYAVMETVLSEVVTR